MNRRYSSLIAGFGKRSDHRSRPDPDFCRCFNDVSASVRDCYWRGYSEWQRRNRKEDYVRYRRDCEKNRNTAKNEVDAWPSPFINAIKDKPYKLVFEVPACISRSELFGLEKTGLTCARDPHNQRRYIISGSPLVSGKFSLTLVYIVKGWLKGLPLLSRKIDFFVVPDARSLWQNLPSDQSKEYARPDEDAASLSCRYARLYGASLRGRQHAHAGKARDDAFLIASENDWQVLAVADGAGSAPYSRKGAALACETAVAAILAKLTPGNELDLLFEEVEIAMAASAWQGQAKKIAYDILPNAAFEAYKAIRAEANQKERNSGDYATTLLIAIAKKFSKGWAIGSFQIGDGAMAMFANNDATLLAEPDQGQSAGQTRFITMEEMFEGASLMRRLRFDFVSHLQGLLLMTDGISDAKFDSLAGLKDKNLWQSLWHELKAITCAPEPESGLLDWLGFWSKGNHDDRTLAMLVTGA